MKKTIAILLTFFVMLGIVSPAIGSAAVRYVKMPIVTIRGDANPIYTAGGKKQVTPVDLSTDTLKDMVEEIYPSLVKGMMFDRWDDYIDHFEKAVSSVFEDCRLDNNGEASDGSGIHPDKVKENETSMRSDKKSKDGSYDLNAYVFWYDWRLDPFEIAEQLHEYIQGVKEATGKKWVSIRARCLGGSFLLAYLALYGYSDIYNIALDSTVANGSEKFNDFVCGRLLYDGEAFEREQTDDIYYDSETDTYTFSDYDRVINELIVALIDRCNENGLGKFGEKTFAKIYSKVKDPLMPKLIMASYGTFPGYWTCVLKDDYQTARNFVFGTEEMRSRYAGLIEKLDRYDREVRQRIPEILNEAKEHDSYIGVIVKYGYQLTPFFESRNGQSDGLVNTVTSSFGATCSEIGKTLPEEYIAARKAKGLGNYISPDNIIDASTGLFPDSTWYIKGLHHDSWPSCVYDLLVKICTRYGRLTIYEEEAYPQFMIFDKDSFKLRKMTPENCHTEDYDAEEISEHGVKLFFRSYFKLFSKLFEFFRQFIKNLFK